MSAVLALTSCNDFLDKYPKYGVDPESEVTNEIAVALTTACYKTLQSSNMYNQRIWSLDIIAGNSEVGAGGGTDGFGDCSGFQLHSPERQRLCLVCMAFSVGWDRTLQHRAFQFAFSIYLR